MLWGGTTGQESHRFIHYGFAQNARKLGIETTWVPDAERSRETLTPGTTVISADIWNKYIGEAVRGVDYVLHNYDGSHLLCQTVEPERLLRIQVWTTSASGETWDTCRQYDREARTLFQPWGTDLLAEEFMDPVFNPGSRDAVFVGAIWREMFQPSEGPAYDLGNERTIDALRVVLHDRGLTFKHLTQVSERENIEAIRAARIAPAVAGGWQVRNGYLPCRSFKNASYGVLMFTNIPMMNQLFGDSAVPGESLEELVTNTLRLKRHEYETRVRAQQLVASRFTYRQSLESIDRALEEGRS